jgi:putative phosphoesterase
VKDFVLNSIRLGLISDTHWPTRIPKLPYAAIENAFRNVDAILHAGDIETAEVLDHLSGIAPTSAVRGDDDKLDLPLKRVLQFAGVRVGLIHGHRNPLVENYFRIQRRLGKMYAGSRHLLESLPERFDGEKLDVIVFGHLHAPMCIERDGLLMVNPGAVYAMSLESAMWQLAREKNPLRRQMLIEHIRRYREDPRLIAPRSTVAILEIAADKQIRTKIVDLPLVAYS